MESTWKMKLLSQEFKHRYLVRHFLKTNVVITEFAFEQTV